MQPVPVPVQAPDSVGHWLLSVHAFCAELHCPLAGGHALLS